MGRVDQGGVGQGQELVVQRPVQVAGRGSSAVQPIEVSRSGRPTSPMKRVSPVSTAHGSASGVLAARRSRSTPGVCPGVCRISSVDLAQREALAVGERLDGEVGLGDVAVGDDGAGGFGELEVPGEEVGVEVGLDHPLDAQAVGRGVGEVLADVALRVDHDGAAGGRVADQVAVERQAGEVVLAEEHRSGLLGSVGEKSN